MCDKLQLTLERPNEYMEEDFVTNKWREMQCYSTALKQTQTHQVTRGRWSKYVLKMLMIGPS